MKALKNCRSLLLAMALWASPMLASAQSFTDYVWKGEMAAAPKDVSAEFLQSDAIIYKTETYSRGTFSGEFPYIEQLATYRTQTHLKILKESALKDYKNVSIPRFRGQIGDYVQVREYDIRIKKAKDGKVLDLEVKKLPKRDIKEGDDEYDAREDYYFYEIPDLEVGDEMEIVSVIESKFLDQGRIVNLYQQYPTLESVYTISIPNKVRLVGNVYNKMPQPKITKGEQMVYSWTMNNLKAIPEANAEGSIFTKELPYFIYELNFDAFRGSEGFTPKNYRDLAIQYVEDFLSFRVNKAKKVDEFYATLFGATTDGLERLAKLNDFIAKQMQIVPRKELSDKDGIDDYLTNKKTDYAGISRIYLDFFERFKMEHYLAFAKNRFDGDFDPSFLSSAQIGDYFFVVKIGDNFFSVSGLNGINEMPYNLVGVPYYLVNLSDRSKKDLESINFGDAALRESSDNKQFSRSQAEINVGTGKATVKNTASYTGMYATGSRGGYVGAMKADTLVKAIQKGYDNYYKDHAPKILSAEIKQYEVLPPYPFKLETSFELSDIMRKQDDGSQVINLEKWINHSLRDVVSAESRTLDYFLPFLGSDTDDLILIFDKDIESSNIADLNIKVDGEYASYECKATQLKPNTLRIESKYIIKHPEAKNAEKPLVIAKDKLKNLDEANKAFEKVEKTKLKIKFKG